MGAVVDVMHTVQHGIIMYCLESFKKGLGAEILHMLDWMAITFEKHSVKASNKVSPSRISLGVSQI
jgi:hypothetical protein